MDGPVCLSIHPVKDSGDVSSSERVQTQLRGTRASVSTGAHGFAWTWVFIFLGRTPWSGTNVSYSKRRISFFKNLPNCSPERLDPFFFFHSHRQWQGFRLPRTRVGVFILAVPAGAELRLAVL